MPLDLCFRAKAGQHAAAAYREAALVGRPGSKGAYRRGKGMRGQLFDGVCPT